MPKTAVFFPPWNAEGPSAPLAMVCRSRWMGTPWDLRRVEVAVRSRVPAMRPAIEMISKFVRTISVHGS
jgi:hypothetical protein